MLEWPRLHTQLLVQNLVGFLYTARLIQIAEVRPFHIEGDCCNRSFVLREMREQGREQPLDRTRLRRQAGDTRDVEVSCLRAEQEISVEVNHRISATSAINSDRNSGVRAFSQIAVQKWNSCGVLGFRSVATTRPSASLMKWLSGILRRRVCRTTFCPSVRREGPAGSSPPEPSAISRQRDRPDSHTPTSRF